MKTITNCMLLGFASCVLCNVAVAAGDAKAAAPARPVSLTPPPPVTPRINGPLVFGVRPGSPFLYSIPATGERPMTFTVEGLPAGLKLDAATGRISGSLTKVGEHAVTLSARNARGENKRAFRIVVGDEIGLTPPLGWNSWNCWHVDVTQEAMLAAAKAMVANGLDQHGWTYVNIDDAWQGLRGGPLNAIQPNKKFPDMKGMADQIHGMGLKFGIYSGPWLISYAGHLGSSCDNEDGTYEWIVAGNYNEFTRIGKDRGPTGPEKKALLRHGKVPFYKQDARQWAAWGVDYLKFDWAIDVVHGEAMGQALRESGRDIFYSLSNSANFGKAANWGKIANSWRTTGDIRDTWESITRIGFAQDKWVPYQSPGHYNDPDMFEIGFNGGARGGPKQLTPDEQYTHVSLWCLLSAPLLLGCDLEKLDPFTIGLITNDEVLAIDQDLLCKPAANVVTKDGIKVYVKQLADGTKAVGLINIGDKPATGTLLWEEAVLKGPQRLRDLWRQKDLGTMDGKFSAEIPAHGVILLKLTPDQKK